MAPVKITVRNNGSLRIEGDFEVFDADGIRFDLAGRREVKLCRCGLSKDAPFCDSSHKNGAFVSEVKARALPPPAVPPAAAPAAIPPVKA
jgi:CDGSH-type Zn-finger protein